MKTGMLWFDNDTQHALDQKIQRAAAYYRQKYGSPPTLCIVHPTMLPAAQSGADAYKAGAIEVRAAGWVLPNHYFIGSNGPEDEDRLLPF